MKDRANDNFPKLKIRRVFDLPFLLCSFPFLIEGMVSQEAVYWNLRVIPSTVICE
jgi:hypothetical protein